MGLPDPGLGLQTQLLYKEAELDSTLTNLHAASKAVREISEHPWKLLTGQGQPKGEEGDE